MRIIKYIVVVLIAVACGSLGDEHKSSELDNVLIEIDSLVTLSENNFNSTQFNDSLFDSILEEAFELANVYDLHKSKIEVYRIVGKRYRNVSNFGMALYFYQKALAIANQLDDDSLKSHMKGDMAVVFRRIADNGKALSLHFQALEWAEAAGDTALILKSNNGIGNVYLSYKNLPKAIFYFQKSLKLLSNGYPNKLSEAINTNNIGEAWLELGNPDSSLYYINRSYDLNVEMNSELGKAICEQGIGDVYVHKKEYDKALAHYGNSIKINKEVGNSIYLADNYKSVGKTYLLMKQSKEAEKFLLIALQLNKEIGSKSEIVEIQTSLSQLYRKIGNKDKALMYLDEAMVYKDTITDEVSHLNSDGLSALYKTEKQEREILILEQKDALSQLALNRQKWILLGSFIIIIGGLIFMIYAIVQRKQTVKYTLKIQEQNKNIRDSIKYARKIQSAMLTDISLLQDHVADCFLLNLPRDIVSGDFYWHTHFNSSTIVVTADCTGHGVPGALMSMLGVAFLNEIVNKEGFTKPNLILDRLRAQIITQLKQKGNFEDSKDGIDMSVYVIEHSRMKLYFAGANSALFVIRNGKLNYIKGDAMPIGYHPIKNSPFSIQEFDLQKGDCIYSSTDGYSDQFGGEQGTKFMVKNFKKLLVDTSHFPMHEQKNILEQHLVAWKGSFDQLDDIVIVGVRI